MALGWIRHRALSVGLSIALGLYSCASYAETTSVDDSNTAPPSSVPAVPELFSVLNDLDKTVNDVKPQQNFNKFSQRAKTMTGMMLGFQGFDPSKEGADVALNQSSARKNNHLAQVYSNEEQIHQKHSKIVSCVMDLAAGIGTPDDERADEIVASALLRLRELVGPEEAENILKSIESLKKTLDSQDTIVPRRVWAVRQRDAILARLIDNMTQSDPIITDTKQELSRYNTLSQGQQLSAKAILSILGIAGFIPTLIAPIAGTSSFLFTSATGGPEQEKLLKEIYMSKSLEQRQDMIKEDAHMILDTYFMALATDNKVLLSCSRSLLQHACGSDDKLASQLFEANQSVTGKIVKYSPYMPARQFTPYVSGTGNKTN